MSPIIKSEYQWFLKYNMTIRVDENCLIEFNNKLPMENKIRKCGLSDLGHFNFKYAVKQKEDMINGLLC